MSSSISDWSCCGRCGMPDGFAVLALLVATLRAATPLLLAGVRGLVAERSGVLNLGVEGRCWSAPPPASSPPLPPATRCWAAVAALAGALMALLFGFLTLTLRANQVACGRADHLRRRPLGADRPALPGHADTGLATHLAGPRRREPDGHQQFMLLDPVVWLALATPFLTWVFLYRTRRGWWCGRSAKPRRADALGYSVLRGALCRCAVRRGDDAAWPAPTPASSIRRCGTEEDGGRARLDRSRLWRSFSAWKLWLPPLGAGAVGFVLDSSRIPRRAFGPPPPHPLCCRCCPDPRHRGGAVVISLRCGAAEADAPAGIGQAVQRHRLNP